MTDITKTEERYLFSDDDGEKYSVVCHISRNLDSMIVKRITNYGKKIDKLEEKRICDKVRERMLWRNSGLNN